MNVQLMTSMMENNSEVRGAENECSSTSHEDNAVNMTTSKIVRISPNHMDKGFVDVSSTSEDIVDNDDQTGDGEMCIDMSMTAATSSSNNLNGQEDNEMNEHNDGIESPEDLTIDENLEVEGGGSVSVHMEEEKNNCRRSPPLSPPSETNNVSENNDTQNAYGDDVSQESSGQVIASPPSSPPEEETRSSSVSIDPKDEIVETKNESFDESEDLVIAESGVESSNSNADNIAVVEEEDVEMKEDEKEGVREIEEISSPVPEDCDSPMMDNAPVVPTEDSNSNNADTPSSPSPESPPKTESDLRIEEMSSAQSPDNMEMDSSDPVDPHRAGESSLDLDEVSTEKTVSQVDLISSPGCEKAEESSPDSPEDDLMRGNNEDKLDDSISYDDCSSREPKSPDGLNGTPVSSVLEEESQSQSSLPPVEDVPDKAKQTESKKGAKSAPAEDVDEEDLEDGEIMDEEEEKDDEESVKAVTPPPAVVKSKSSSKEKEKSKEKESSKSKDSSKESSSKRKQQREESGNDTLDPVKKLLAEVKERDKSEKEKEREKRRREKKRSRDDKKEEERQTKKKKRKMSEEEEEGGPGEEFLLVRGASPSEENWEEFGGPGDDRRGKNQRRRDSEGSGSPQNRHHNRRPEIEASPIRGRPGSDRGKRMERREPKSEVICAYFMQGKCQKSGDECNFSHDAIPPRKMELCKFWMMECCAKKEKCLYLHNDFPCKFYHTGLVCRQGDRCKFSHNPLNEGTKGVLLKHIETAPKEILGDFPRLNRQGALNLINKMEAKIKGVPYIEEPEDNHGGHMNHGPPHGHGGPPPHHHHGHGPPDRHGPHHGHDRSRGDRGHYGGPPQHDNHRGRGDRDRGPPPPQDRDRRQSRWEQSQPTKDDQHKLQELMNEAGISGYYKDTMENNNSNQQGMPSQGQPNVFPPQMQNLQAPLLPLLPQFLPGMLPQAAAQNPALATVLASLNIPGSSIPPNALSQFGAALIDTPPGSQSSQTLSQNSQQGSQQEEPKGDANASSDTKNSAIPDNLPKMQRELFLRIQQQQLKNESKSQTQEKEPEEPEENWYSDDEEEDTKKKEELKAEINDQISSVLSQIRQQSQQQQQQQQPASTAPKDTAEGTKNFFGDTDLRSAAPSTATDFKDVDLRTSNIFKKINILPATEINASLSSHGPMVYKVMVVAGLRDRPDYSQVRQTLTASAILMDPRLGPKRSNSIPTPASPTDQPSDVGGLSQPLSIPEGAGPVFDPRMRSGGGPQNAPAQNQMMPDNSLLCSMNMNDFNNPFNRDPRGGPPGGPQGGSGPGGVPNNNANQQAAQNLALAAAAAAMMQQQWPNGQPPFDPNLFMLAGLPFLPQAPPPVTTSQGQNANMQNMEFGNSLLGNPGMRFRPPFMNQPPQQQQQQHPPQQQPPPSSSWERFRQGQGDLSPPL